MTTTSMRPTAAPDIAEEFSLSRRAYGQDPSLTATWVGVSLTGFSARTAPAYTPYCSSPRTRRRRSTKSSRTSPQRIRFVRTTGAVYAFTPSITTLRRLAANQSLHEKV